ncbi:MAG: tRNA (adenosine(37)-N6)-threonylcarbamoyltransferase complex dimerization subunit type 1 TsaB [Bacteroidales bacterium]|nr:tRNA (adenosine(37)-N6)-threonylcarbamoyltransferase complex dimerization subunit type 1 TsaB [Bacteroidales bacterium]
MREKEPLIINIETAAAVCSAALTKGETVLNYVECTTPNAHSQMLTLLLEKVFLNTYYSMGEADAVAVSKGPGSYTGLRIGMSSAKGIAYALDIPLICIDTTLILAQAARQKYADSVYMPMIDARRMEVYTALYDKDLNTLRKISADIVNEDIYASIPADRIILAGDGAAKCKAVLTDSRYVLAQDVYLCAKHMAHLSSKFYKEKKFESVAYAEPYYLKEFIAVKSTVKGLYDK